MEQGRTHPIFIAAGVAVLLFSLIGAAALTGLLPNANTREASAEVRALAQSHAGAGPGRMLPAEPSSARGKQAGTPACTNCGVIEAMRPVETKGDAIEKNVKKRTAWRVTVRLDNGVRKTLSQAAQPPFEVGERVRIVDGGAAIERA